MKRSATAPVLRSNLANWMHRVRGVSPPNPPPFVALKNKMAMFCLTIFPVRVSPR